MSAYVDLFASGDGKFHKTFLIEARINLKYHSLRF